MQADGVEHRRRDDAGVARGVVEQRDRPRDAGRARAMRHRDGLWPAGGAAGEVDRQQVAGRDRGQRSRARRDRGGEVARVRAAGLHHARELRAGGARVGDLRGEVAMDEEAAHSREARHLRELAAGGARRQVGQHQPGARGGEEEKPVLEAVGQHGADAGARREARAGEHRGEPVGLGVERRMGQGRVLAEDGRGGRREARARPQHVADDARSRWVRAHARRGGCSLRRHFGPISTSRTSIAGRS